VLDEGCSECGQVELLLCKRRLFSFLFVSSPLMEIVVSCCVPFIFTSCEDLKVYFFPFNFLININININIFKL
jgi:hypothetical protein